MALDLNKWVNYAKARLESAVGRGNDELTRLEAEREVELADKPWLRADAEAPTLDEARARIEWEARRQEELAAAREGATTHDATPDTPGGAAAPDSPANPSGKAGASRPPADPEELRLAAEAEQAKLAIEARDRAAAQRLDEIRRELGVDAPPAGDADR